MGWAVVGGHGYSSWGISLAALLSSYIGLEIDETGGGSWPWAMRLIDILRGAQIASEIDRV